MVQLRELNKNEYRCDCCQGVFDKGWSDEEAIAEKDETFGAVPMDDCDIICDDCYEKMKPMFS